MMVRAQSAALHLCSAPFGEKPVDSGATQARDAKQGPPRSEGIVPLPELRSDSREGGSGAAAQGVVPYLYPSRSITSSMRWATSTSLRPLSMAVLRSFS